MQITARATVLAVALLVSTPLLAADSGTSRADAPAQETHEPTEQGKCTLPALPSTDLATGLAGLLPKPGSLPPDPAEIDRRLRKIDACARAVGIRAPGEGTTSSATTDAASDSAAATLPSSSSGL